MVNAEPQQTWQSYWYNLAQTLEFLVNFMSCLHFQYIIYILILKLCLSAIDSEQNWHLFTMTANYQLHLFPLRTSISSSVAWDFTSDLVRCNNVWAAHARPMGPVLWDGLLKSLPSQGFLSAQSRLGGLEGLQDGQLPTFNNSVISSVLPRAIMQK